MALFTKPSRWERVRTLLFPEAVAALTGLSAVPDGTVVQLGHIDRNGNFMAVLASTTVSGGRYSFNLTSLGLIFSSTLVASVSNPASGTRMRAFVTRETVNLDPISESAVQLVVDRTARIPSSDLSHFTPQELNDLNSAINVLTAANQTTTGIGINATVTTIKDQAINEPQLITFLTAADSPGATTEGPGDIGNYLPLTQGNTWHFQGTHSETGRPTTQYSNTVKVNGTKSMESVTTTILAESNPFNSSSAEEVYYLKDSRGIWNYGNNDSSDTLSPNITPFRELLFPLDLGVTSEVVNQTRVNFGQDLDKDGKNETADVLSHVTVEAFENITVPKGTFANAAKTVHKTTITVFPSTGSQSVTVIGTQTLWFVSNLGAVKRTMVLQADGQATESVTEELVDATIVK
jgi:hypothetical protein